MGKLSFSQKRVIIYLTCDDVFRESKIFKNNGRNGLLGVFLGISPLKKTDPKFNDVPYPHYFALEI